MFPSTVSVRRWRPVHAAAGSPNLFGRAYSNPRQRMGRRIGTRIAVTRICGTRRGSAAATRAPATALARSWAAPPSVRDAARRLRDTAVPHRSRRTLSDRSPERSAPRCRRDIPYRELVLVTSWRSARRRPRVGPRLHGRAARAAAGGRRQRSRRASDSASSVTISRRRWSPETRRPQVDLQQFALLQQGLRIDALEVSAGAYNDLILPRRN